LQGQWGGAAWQSGGGEHGNFLLQLFPESPKVWRVFKADHTLSAGGEEKAHLVAEFDPQGRLLSSRSARAKPLPLLRQGTLGSIPASDCPGGRNWAIMPASANMVPAPK